MRGLVGEARRGARVLDPQKQEWAGSGDDYWNQCGLLWVSSAFSLSSLLALGAPNCGLNRLYDMSVFWPRGFGTCMSRKYIWHC